MHSTQRQSTHPTKDTPFDIGIVGGGPAGLSAAIYAAKQGLSVVIFEPKPDAIDKACGEGLMPSAVESLHNLGVVIPSYYPFKGIRYIGEKGTSNQQNLSTDAAEGYFQSGNGWGVRRLVLHKALKDRAIELGVTWRDLRVQHILEQKEHVEIEDCQVRYCLAADGLHSPLRKKLGLSKPSKLANRIGIRRHYTVQPWSDFVEVYWSEFGECYITPVSENQVGVAILAYSDRLPDPSDQHRFDQLLQWFPGVAHRVEKAEYASTIRGAGSFEQRLHSPMTERILFIGDAAGYLDPITGEGIRLGLLSAQAAIDAIQSNHPKGYIAKHRRILRPYWVLTGGLLWLRQRKWGRAVMIPFLQRVPFAFSRIVSALGG